MNPSADSLGPQDAEHLRLLSIFHYILAGLSGLFSLFPLIHLAMGVAMLNGAFRDARGNGPPPAFGWFFIGIAVVFILAGLTFSACLVLSGRWLAARTHYWFCFILACVSTPFFPFGTALGVFTIVVLSRTQVKAAFLPAPR